MARRIAVFSRASLRLAIVLWPSVAAADAEDLRSDADVIVAVAKGHVVPAPCGDAGWTRSEVRTVVTFDP